MRTLRRQARPSPSCDAAPKARVSVGSSTSVTSAPATDSPMRPAKKDRPFTTASPDSADDDDGEQRRGHAGVEDDGAASRLCLLRTEHPRGAEHGVVHRLVGDELARSASDAEAGAGLGVGALAGNGVDGEEGRRTPPVRRDAGGRGECHFGPTVRVIGRGDLADAGIGGAGGPLELQRPVRPSSPSGWRRRRRPRDRARLAATPSGSAKTTSGSGVAKRALSRASARVAAMTSGSSEPAQAKPTRLPSPAWRRRAGAVGVEEDADADARRVGGGQGLDLALVGPHLGVGAPGDVDLEAFARLGLVDDRGCEGQEVRVGAGAALLTTSPRA